MVYGVVLAGGIGSRMGNVDRPKQYLHIGKKPIIVHTVEKFIINDNFEKVIVLCPAQWITYTKYLFRKHLPENSNVVVIEGGTFVAYKGQKAEEEIKEAEKAIRLLGGKIDRIETVNLEDESAENHALVYIKKVKKTPAKFPRKSGTARKEPL